VLSAQSGERRRIAGRLGCDLGCRGEAGGNGEGYSVEEVTPRDRRHAPAKCECARELDQAMDRAGMVRQALRFCQEAELKYKAARYCASAEAILSRRGSLKIPLADGAKPYTRLILL